jgi:hypothetical protein
LSEVVAGLPGDDMVKAMFNATPGPSLGEQVRAIFINKIAGSTPGRYTRERDTAESDANYRDVFFPGWSALPYADEIAARTGLGDGWWSDYAVALLCQAIYNQAKATRRFLKSAEIDQAADKASQELHVNVVPFFVYLLGKEFSFSFDAFDRPKAKEQYIALLKAVVPVWDLALAQSMNKNPEWQLLHHFIKLSALGASSAEIKLVNGQLEELGMPIPSSLLGDRWTQHISHLGKPVTYLDIGALASDGIKRIVEIFLSRTTSKRQEYYARQFINGPGQRFKR